MDFGAENAGFLICLHFRSCMTCHQGRLWQKRFCFTLPSLLLWSYRGEGGAGQKRSKGGTGRVGNELEFFYRKQLLVQ